MFVFSVWIILTESNINSKTKIRILLLFKKISFCLELGLCVWSYTRSYSNGLFQGLDAIAVAPYLGFCKVFQGTRNSLWFAYGAKAVNFYADSLDILNSS